MWYVLYVLYKYWWLWPDSQNANAPAKFSTEDEILEATIEMHSRIINNFVLKDSQMALLRRYHNEYCVKNKNSSEFVPISVNWLEKNYALYLDH